MLESFAVLDVLDEVIFIVAHLVAAIKEMGVRIGWLGRMTYESKDHLALIQREEQLSTRVAEL